MIKDINYKPYSIGSFHDNYADIIFEDTGVMTVPKNSASAIINIMNEAYKNGVIAGRQKVIRSDNSNSVDNWNWVQGKNGTNGTSGMNVTNGTSGMNVTNGTINNMQQEESNPINIYKKNK
jgi:hypothetical protein